MASRNQTRVRASPDSPTEERPFKKEIGLFESCIMAFGCLGTLELGFTFTTLFIYAIITWAFAEIIQVQARSDKDEHI